MHLRKPILALVAGLFIIYSCKKNKDDVSVPPRHEDQPCTQQRAAGDGNIISGQYIVALNPGVTGRNSSERAIEDMGKNILVRNNIESKKIKKSFMGEPGGFVAHLSQKEVEELKKDEAVKKIEPDRIVSLSHCFEVVEPRLITWNVKQTGYGDGRGKTAWIIDSGIDFGHPDLNVDQTRSRSFVAGTTSADDENGHGTHVAGVIGGKNNTIGVLGIASNATLIALKVLGSDGIGSLSSIIQALGYVNVNGKAGDVVNMSLGNEGVSEIFDEQVVNTANHGILISIAAGNDSRPAREFSPARVNGPNIFTVSAVDSLGRFASFSNYGNDVVDFAAPGVRIISTFINGQYAIMSGTSMAAPHVAGLLLLNGRNISSSGTASNDPDGTPDVIAHK